jgi:hypothetical protein
VSERTISIGYVALGLSVLAVAWAWRKAAFWLVAALFFFVLALGPQWNFGDITQASIPPAVLGGQEIPSFTPYGLLNALVPFMRISRSVSRFALMVQLCAGVLAGLGLYLLLARLAARRTLAALVGGSAIVLLLAEFWVAPYPLSPPDTPAYYAQLAADPDSRAVLNLPMNYDRPGYLLYQTIHGKPLTVAYISRDDPRTLTERAPVLQHFRHLGDDIIAGDPAAVAETVFGDLGVGTVVLDRYKMPGGLEREYTEALAGRIFGGQAPLFGDERITVYRVPEALADAGSTPVPYLRLGPQNWGPRQVDADGAPRRGLTGGPAAVEVLHAEGPVQVAVRYRTADVATEPTAAIDARGAPAGTATGAAAATSPAPVLAAALPDGTVLAELPPAPQGAEAVLDLPPGTGAFLLEPLPADGQGAVFVEQLRLEP